MSVEIPPSDFDYRLVVDGRLVSEHLRFRGPVRVGDLFPLAEGGGRVTEITKDDDEDFYEIHVVPLVQSDADRVEVLTGFEYPTGYSNLSPPVVDQYVAVAADRANAASADANGLVDRHNASVAKNNRLTMTAGRRQRRFERTLDNCLDENGGSGWSELVAPLEAELTDAVATIATVEDVVCHPVADWRRLEQREAGPEHVLEGYVFEGDTVIHLSPRVCHALAKRLLDLSDQPGCYRASGRSNIPLCPPPPALLAASIETLAHEAMHVKA